MGMNGARVNAIVEELRGEKIDIINWDENAALLIENALSPAKVISVIADAEEKSAKVVVPDYQLSLAIGKEGQNARLAARLTGFKIDIKSETQAREAGDFFDYENDYEDADEYDYEDYESGSFEESEDSGYADDLQETEDAYADSQEESGYTDGLGESESGAQIDSLDEGFYEGDSGYEAGESESGLNEPDSTEDESGWEEDSIHAGDEDKEGAGE